jgi:hypothetical protein
MLAEAIHREKKKGYITGTQLVIVALATAFFSRLTFLAKIPSAINFLHFATVPLAFSVVLLRSRSKDQQQLAVVRQILAALLLVLIVSFASAFISDAGVINVILHFLLFQEPVMLLLAIICIPMSVETLNRFRTYILSFGFINLALALVQKFILKWDILGRDPCPALDEVDTITGVFVCQGAGVIVSASVSMALAVHFFITAKHRPIWMRALIGLACLIQIVEADAKQVLIVGAVAFALLSLANMKDIRKAILSIISVVAGAHFFWWAMFKFEFLQGFAGWVRPDIYGPDGEATKFKLFGIKAILEYMHSPLNWWFGLGPGHTIDRLGMLMLREFSPIFDPLGATRNSLSLGVWADMGNSWLANGSTMFSPFFGWAAIWGDLGIIGLVAYFYLYFLIWHHICKDDLSKFQVLCVFVVGWIQAGLQEPGFMLYVAALIGLRWQELHHKAKDKASMKSE